MRVEITISCIGYILAAITVKTFTLELERVLYFQSHNHTKTERLTQWETVTLLLNITKTMSIYQCHEKLKTVFA